MVGEGAVWATSSQRDLTPPRLLHPRERPTSTPVRMGMKRGNTEILRKKNHWALAFLSQNYYYIRIRIR